jgi:1-aminocyclopropane-1-carboxylate deaminase/D-cysteine desulfhydrase-like pyridoxal-dependent ACC family enzyme
MTHSKSRAQQALRQMPFIGLGNYPTPIEEMARLRETVGCRPRLHVKRDDAISFAFGGNKVRKLEHVAAQARADGADTFVTVGGVQSNHARVTAAAATRLGMRCVIVANGEKPDRLTANALLNELLGAEVVYIASREEREAAMAAQMERLRREGRTPYEIELGASTPLGALGYVRAIEEMLEQAPPPDVIVHSTSSGGTQAGLVAGCALFGLKTRILGISADEPSARLQERVATIVRGIGDLLELDGASLAAENPIDVDDGFVGGGYGVPTVASEGAIELAARTEAIMLDPTYTAKAMAGMLAWLRSGRLDAAGTVLFWHTGGQVTLFR